MVRREVGPLLRLLDRGIVTTGDVDELVALYARALGASSMSLAQAFGFHPWVRTHQLSDTWMATHRRLQHQDPSPAQLLSAPPGSSYRVSSEPSPEVRERELFCALGEHGYADAAITTVHNPFGEPLFMALYRERGDREFSVEDAELIRLLHPHLARALLARSALDALRPDGPSSAADAARRAQGHAFIGERAVEWSRSANSLFESAFDGGPRPRSLERCLIEERNRRRSGSEPRSFRIGPIRVELAQLADQRTLALFYDERGQPTFGRAASLLTPAQLRVAEGLARDLSMREIAEEMSLSTETVRSHVRAACARLGVRRATALMAALLSR